ncbi:VCBS repeat-containing protein [Maribacter polysiphoniae]|uniref:ASPIC/UnbV protein n=1 Tax=Maribacter polysiphoniae TaxID=429344 RepID=A0A316ENM2_9FLAO|nr:CRTAC1 family protein [Maribacter polysiphoniae]MBD1259026.1 VCBS repeat-containing protein [Maribacter polysiphoniae]PWK24580.1 ASPIC/UnbV protein [Maribacter polysiphoniae]
MKSSYFFLFLSLLSMTTFVGCKESAEEKKQKAIELISTQTMGLAFLEAFKLEEAETTFLKYIELAPDKKMGYANLGLVYLRMGKYDEAKEQLAKAIDIDGEDADINLILATVYQMNDEKDKAIAVLTNSLGFAPDHAKTLYMLSELYATSPDTETRKTREKYVLQLAGKVPDNIVPALELTELFIRGGESDKAIAQLENIQKQFPEFPKEAVDYFSDTIDLLRVSDTEKALTSFTIFHNYLKVTFPYQSGIKDLKGTRGSVIGFPLVTYDLKHSPLSEDTASTLDLIKFTDVTGDVGLDAVPIYDADGSIESKNPTHVSIADYDSDGDIDMYVGSYDPTDSSYKHFLFNNDLNWFWDLSKDIGINHSGIESSAAFADYDNDGFLDLYVVRPEGDKLYRNAGNGKYEDVTAEAGVGERTGGTKVLFFDMDHDGDLDFFELSGSANLVYRNNGDRTFKEQAGPMGLAGANIQSNDAAFGDFDDDGDLDLFVANEKANNNLYSNQRQGVFKDVLENSAFKNQKGSTSVAVGDWNNDGFLDLFTAGDHEESNGLYKNQRDAVFEPVHDAEKMFKALKGIAVLDSQFFDFDNDGFLDLVVAGKPNQKNNQGLFLYHNEGDGKFTDVTHLLPERPKSARQISLFDFEGDGDLDLVLAGLHGGVFLLRNDGGNLNHYVNVKLVGLRTGSAKNNYFGIGAKVEMRAGTLYQTKVVNDPNIYFGLGNRTKADIIRITWTNGVPQNILLPESDQSLIETQTLKGSCPFLYTWNGDEFVFVKDITWRSALGMPLGIMGGTARYSFADASDDYIKIPGDMLQEKDGAYIVQMTSELWETIYMDKMQLVAIDHPASVDVYVPEQFSPPPFPGLDMIKVVEKYFPISAKDGDGNDLLSLIKEKDDKYIANFMPDKYQGVTAMHDLILDPGGNIPTDNLWVVLNGWIFPTDASINVALSQSDELVVKSPSIQVINQKGEWETVIPNLGFPMGKDKNVIADLSGKFLSKDRRIRIQTNMEIYWDQIFFAQNNPLSESNTTILNPTEADLHYRGFSKSYRKGGRYGPHWFDYGSVDTSTKWRDLIGNYTRYGDVLPLLTASDNAYIISNAGDETTIKFNANELPKLKDGWTRDFFIHSVGWVKDGDLNTAHGNTVLPLPYHGMGSYPPSEKDTYPNTPELQKYHETYNTRTVTNEGYRNSLKTDK